MHPKRYVVAVVDGTGWFGEAPVVRPVVVPPYQVAVVADLHPAAGADLLDAAAVAGRRGDRGPPQLRYLDRGEHQADDPGDAEQPQHQRPDVVARDRAAAGGGHRPIVQSRARCRAMTIRWIWFVPSTICMTLASRIQRSTGWSAT